MEKTEERIGLLKKKSTEQIAQNNSDAFFDNDFLDAPKDTAHLDNLWEYVGDKSGEKRGLIFRFIYFVNDLILNPQSIVKRADTISFFNILTIVLMSFVFTGFFVGKILAQSSFGFIIINLEPYGLGPISMGLLRVMGLVVFLAALYFLFFHLLLRIGFVAMRTTVDMGTLIRFRSPSLIYFNFFLVLAIPFLGNSTFIAIAMFILGLLVSFHIDLMSLKRVIGAQGRYLFTLFILSYTICSIVFSILLRIFFSELSSMGIQSLPL